MTKCNKAKFESLADQQTESGFKERGHSPINDIPVNDYENSKAVTEHHQKSNVRVHKIELFLIFHSIQLSTVHTIIHSQTRNRVVTDP